MISKLNGKEQKNHIKLGKLPPGMLAQLDDSRATGLSGYIVCKPNCIAPTILIFKSDKIDSWIKPSDYVNSYNVRVLTKSEVLELSND